MNPLSEQDIAAKNAANTQIERIMADPESLQTQRSQDLCARIIVEGFPFLEDPKRARELLLKTIIGNSILRIEQEAKNPVPVEAE